MTVWRWVQVIVMLMAMLYGPHIMSAGWVYEDGQWRGAMTAPIDLGASRSLTRASWRLTPTPQTAHALSVGLHLGVVGLLSLLAWRLGYSRDGVGLVAVLAAVHPLTVQTVAYAAARTELVAAIGVLLAVVCATGRWWLPWHVVGIFVGLGLGWLGKESGIVGLALVPLTILARTARPRLWASLLGVSVIGAIAIDAEALQAWANLGEAAGMTTTAGSWLLLQAAAAYRLLGLTLWPAGLTVDADIDLIPLVLQWFALAGLCGLAGLTWILYRTQPRVAYGLAWCVLSLLPRLIIQTPRGYLTDAHFYMPLLGMILAGVAWWDGWHPELQT